MAAQGIVIGLLLTAAVTGAEVRRAEVNYADGLASIDAQVLLDAGVDEIRAILIDYDRMHRMSATFTGSEVLERYSPKRAKRKVTIRTCVVLFCFDLDMVEQAEEREGNEFVATIVAHESDFHGGQSTLQLTEQPDGTTLVLVDSFQQPQLWIPPIIGLLLVKKKMRAELEDFMERLEALAEACEPRVLTQPTGSLC